MYSSSISDCTAYNEAYCDVGNGTSRRLLPTFSMRLQIFDLDSRISALRASKVERGLSVAFALHFFSNAEHINLKVHVFLVKDYKNDAKLLHFFILVILYYQQIAL